MDKNVFVYICTYMKRSNLNGKNKTTHMQISLVNNWHINDENDSREAVWILINFEKAGF